jgi:hypothetical protein
LSYAGEEFALGLNGMPQARKCWLNIDVCALQFSEVPPSTANLLHGVHYSGVEDDLDERYSECVAVWRELRGRYTNIAQFVGRFRGYLSQYSDGKRETLIDPSPRCGIHGAVRISGNGYEYQKIDFDMPPTDHFSSSDTVERGLFSRVRSIAAASQRKITCACLVVLLQSRKRLDGTPPAQNSAICQVFSLFRRALLPLLCHEHPDFLTTSFWMCNV